MKMVKCGFTPLERAKWVPFLTSFSPSSPTQKTLMSLSDLLPEGLSIIEDCLALETFTPKKELPRLTSYEFGSFLQMVIINLTEGDLVCRCEAALQNNRLPMFMKPEELNHLPGT